MELPVKFVYVENGIEKSSLDEHRRRCEIMERNRRLHQQHQKINIEEKEK